MPELVEFAPYVFSALLLLVVSVLGLINSNKKSQQLWLEKLDQLKIMRLILARTQQHRALSNALLNGEGDRQSEIRQLEREISRQINCIGGKELPPSLIDDFDAITVAWKKLAAGYKRVSINDNVRLHNELIARVLFLMEDLAETSRYHSHMKAFPSWNLTHALSHLELAEVIGQARAIGTGVAAAGACGSVAKIRLDYLVERIQHFVDDPKMKHKDKNGVSEFSQLIKQVTQVESTGISVDEYYKQATTLIDSIYHRFDNHLEQLGDGKAGAAAV